VKKLKNLLIDAIYKIMSVNISYNKWACGCPKLIPCQKKGYVQITLSAPLALIPQVGSLVACGDATGLYLAISTDHTVIWVEKITGDFSAAGDGSGTHPKVTTSPPQIQPVFAIAVSSSFCCPKCTLQYIRNGVIVCQGTGSLPNTNYNTAFNSDYYFKQYPKVLPNAANKWNCCHGQFKWLPPSVQTDEKRVFFTKNNRGKVFGDISYPRNQRGRWNQSNSNWKLYPRNSIGRTHQLCRVPGRTLCPASALDAPIQYKQSGRLFQNTNPNMSKRQLFSYLTRNRKYLNR
jgi:hypothetical protein